MKKILLVLMFAVAAQIASAQDFKKLQNTILLQKWEDAKTEVDKLGNDPKAQSKPTNCSVFILSIRANCFHCLWTPTPRLR